MHTRQEREQAARGWLLLSAEHPAQARREWDDSGIALLRCGALFAAVRVSGDLVRAAAGTGNTAKIDAFLAEALQGGPVFMDLYAQRYYVLVPVSAGQRYEWAARRDPEAEFLGRGCFLGVPRPDATEPEGVRSYWCVPMDGPGNLASPDAVSQLLAVARFRRAKAEREADE